MRPNNTDGFKFYKEKKYYLSKNNIPGPGDYTPEKNSSSNYKSVPKWTIGNKYLNTSLFGSFEKSNEDKPVPTKYKFSKNMGEGGPKVKIELLLCVLIIL